jgi:hypothetical protein
VPSRVQGNLRNPRHNGRSPNPRPDCNSLPIDKLVWTQDGPVAIGDLEPGDSTFAPHEPGGAVVSGTSGEIDGMWFGPPSDGVRPVLEGGRDLRLTAEHLVWVVNEGRVVPCRLVPGELQLRGLNGPVGLERVDIPGGVANLSVWPEPLFLVGSGGVVVHNCPVPPGGRPWGKGSRGSAEDSLASHFDKHGAAVGADDAQQYLRKAQAFAQRLRGKGTPVSGHTAGVRRYSKNGRYVDLAPDGTIISFGAR